MNEHQPPTAHNNGDILSIDPEKYEYPISVRYTNPAKGTGSVALSHLFLYFHSYLRSADDDKFDPREAYFPLYRMTEKESGDDFRLPRDIDYQKPKPKLK